MSESFEVLSNYELRALFDKFGEIALKEGVADGNGGAYAWPADDLEMCLTARAATQVSSAATTRTGTTATRSSRASSALRTRLRASWKVRAVYTAARPLQTNQHELTADMTLPRRLRSCNGNRH